jgi:Hypothetical protein (DUF2513)
MKRDMDLCREILQRIEAHPEHNHLGVPEFEGRSPEVVRYHLDLMYEAGLVWSEFRHYERIMSDTEGHRLLGIYMGRQQGRDQYRLTWAGHEFLDAARSDTLWNSAKSKVVNTTGGLAFEFVREVLTQKGKELLGLA